MYNSLHTVNDVKIVKTCQQFSEIQILPLQSH